MQNLNRGKQWPRKCGLLLLFSKGKQSPNRRKFTQSGHPVWIHPFEFSSSPVAIFQSQKNDFFVFVSKFVPDSRNVFLSPAAALQQNKVFLLFFFYFASTLSALNYFLFSSLVFANEKEEEEKKLFLSKFRRFDLGTKRPIRGGLGFPELWK
jgi:hypothetical protein